MMVSGRRWGLIAIVMGTTVVMLGTSAWLAWRHFKQQPVNTEWITGLKQRCEIAMLRDTCGVMKGSAPQASQARLFIAGLGEVDAQAFASLRAAGDAMCQEVAAQCQIDRSGQACKIALAMYPELKSTTP